jgi:hypothetical protein
MKPSLSLEFNDPNLPVKKEIDNSFTGGVPGIVQTCSFK